ncbi:MAG: 2Fe-2S iron-sulfur cluster-binding protein [Planctomycetota bacterium]
MSAPGPWAEDPPGWRAFRVARKRAEAARTWTLELVPEDGGPLPLARPGQYLTVGIDLEGRRQVRCYSLSHAPRADRYQVTIKETRRADGAPGLVSGHVARELGEGARVWLRPPAGEFTIDPARSGPLVLVAGGVGVTPLMSMIEAVAAAGGRREVWLLYGLRDASEHAFRARLAELAAEPWFHPTTSYSRPSGGEEPGARVGRLEVVTLQEVLPPRDEPYDFYLCGPGPLLDAMTSGLDALGVPASRVHVEVFGAPAVKPFTRRLSRRALAAPPRVRFAASEVEAEWDPASASLLDFAMAQGVFFPFACATGHCGTCASRLLAGEVDYPIPPQFAVREGSCLPCIALPRTDVTLDR